MIGPIRLLLGLENRNAAEIIKLFGGSPKEVCVGTAHCTPVRPPIIHLDPIKTFLGSVCAYIIWTFHTLYEHTYLTTILFSGNQQEDAAEPNVFVRSRVPGSTVSISRWHRSRPTD
jgi:hypothetical protein